MARRKPITDDQISDRLYEIDRMIADEDIGWEKVIEERDELVREMVSRAEQFIRNERL